MSSGDLGDGKNIMWKEIDDSMVHSIATEVKDQKETVLVYGGFHFSLSRTEESVEYYRCKVGGMNSSNCECTAELKKENGKYFWYIMGEHRCGSVTQALEVHGMENEISNSGHFKKSVTQTLDVGSAPGSGPPPPYLAYQQPVRSTRGNSNRISPKKRFYDSQQRNRRNYAATNVQNVKLARSHVTSNDQQQRDIPNIMVSNRQPPDIFHKESGQLPQTPTKSNPYANFNPNQGNTNPSNIRNPDEHSGPLDFGFSSFVAFARGGGRQQLQNQSHVEGERYNHTNTLKNCVHVSHLPLFWDNTQLFGVFLPFGRIRSVRVMTRKGISLRYGFVEFMNHEDVFNAIRYLDGMCFRSYLGVDKLVVKFASEKKKTVGVEKNLKDSQGHNTMNHFPQEIDENQQTNGGIHDETIVRNVKSTRDDDTTSKDQPERNTPNPSINGPQKTEFVQEDNSVGGNGTDNNPQQEAQTQNTTSSQELQETEKRQLPQNLIQETEMNVSGHPHQKSVGYNSYMDYNPNQGSDNRFYHSGHYYRNTHGFSSSLGDSGGINYMINQGLHHHPKFSSGQRNNPQRQQLNAQYPPRRVKSTNNLFVFHLPEQWNERNLFRLFSPYGFIHSVHVPIGKAGESKGYGFVCFERYKDAVKAIRAVNGMKVENKLLKVEFANKGG